MRKTLILLAFVVLAVMGMIQTSEAALINGGFETGDLTGWAVNLNGGSANVVTAHGGNFMTYFPIEGSYFLELGAGSANVYQTASQTFAMNAGEILSGWAAFDARDYLPFNDSAYVKIFDSTMNTVWYSDIAAVGNYGDGPWTNWSWAATVSDTYTVQFGVANGGDSALPSYALYDAVKQVPEPATFLLFGAGIAGLGLLRKRVKT